MARGRRKGAPLTPLELRLRELQLLHETAVRLTSLRDVRELLPEMVGQIRHVLEVEIVSIMLLDDRRRFLHIAAAAGLPSDIVETARVPIGEGISGQVAAKGEPILIQDMSKDRAFARSPYHDQYTTESLICVPLKVGDRVLGVINVNNKLGGQPLAESDLSLVTTFSAQAVLALENSRLYTNLEAEVARVTAELRLKNEELRRIQEFNESILTHMGSGLVALDLEGGVTKLNRAAAEMLGVPDPVPSDETLETLFGEDGAARVRAPEPAPGDVMAARQEAFARSRHGRAVLVGFSVSPLLDATGEEVGTILVFRDLTQLKRMEAELVRMDRLASLGILGAGIAHEIRNPLAAIRFNLDFIQDAGGARPELDVIVKNVERLDDLVKKLLRFARPQVPSISSQDLGARVASVAALIAQQAASEGMEVVQELDPDLPPARIDGAQIEQVVLNIALNGLQSMGKGGRLWLRTRRAPPTAEGSSAFVEVLVSDDGPGLSHEQAVQIFDPFFTTREGGTGLGLAVAHRIVQDHGGYLQVADRKVGEERGATFLVGLPLASEIEEGD